MHNYELVAYYVDALFKNDTFTCTDLLCSLKYCPVNLVNNWPEFGRSSYGMFYD